MAKVITRPGDLHKMGKVPAAPAIAVIPEGLTRLPADVSDVCTWTSGAGAPLHAAGDGSTYTRTDATNGDDFLYGRIAGAWVAILGHTA